MISWQDKAIKLLDDSLSPIPQELNGIDWKCERFNINSKQSAMASRILTDTLDCGLIKMENPETSSKRYASYIPFYA